MPTKTFDVNLDLMNSEYQLIDGIEVVSGDTEANVFNINLLKDYQPVNVTGNTAVIVFLKPDNTTVYQNLTLVDAAAGKFTCTLSAQTIIIPGRVRAEVILYEGTKRLTSTRFEFIVRKSLLNENTVESSNEFTALTEALAEVEELKRTGLKGDPGPKGDPGAGLNILGELSDVSDLPELGEEGDAYLIEGYLYVWATDDWLNVGSIQGINWKGNYNSETDYVLNDGVYHEGSSYRALKPTKGNAPTPEGSEYWHPIAIKGAEGSGGGVLYGEDVGSTDDYEITVTPAITSYTAGQMFNVKCNTANTGAATLNVCGLGAVAIKKLTADGLTDLEIGDIPAGGIISVIHNGTYFVAVGLGLGSHKAETATLEDLGHVNHGTLTATIPTSSWTGSEAPYSKTITVTGMLATDNPIVDVDLSEAEDYEEEQEIITAWGNIYRIITDEDEITVYATAVPTVDIPIQLKVVR